MSREQSQALARRLRTRPPTSGDFAQRRAQLDQWALSLTPGAPPEPSRVAEIAPGLTGLWMDPPGGPTETAVMWLHGGAFMLGSANGYRPLGHALAVEADVSVLLLDYPLAPESPFPAALDACGVALDWLDDRASGGVVVGGDSAGGNLAAAVAQDRMRGARQLPAGIWLLSPYLDLTHAGPSIFAREAADPFITDIRGMAPLAGVYASGAPLDDPRVSPLFGPVEGFPPALVQVGSDEVLFDDSRRFTQALWAAGGHCVFQEWVGQAHVFAFFMAELDEGRMAMTQGAYFVRRALGLDGALP